MKKWWMAAGVILIALGIQEGIARTGHEAHEGHGPAVSADKLIAKLVEGNRRYVSGDFTEMHLAPAERAKLSKGQHPFAVVIGCADSRVPPELVFDQSAGQLFVVRVAGQVLDAPTIGSIEYAVEHLGSRLIVVLGHEKCGAVKAAVDGGEAPGHIGSLVTAIAPAVERARDMQGDILANAVEWNVRRVMDELASSRPILSEMTGEGGLTVAGGVYDLDSGKVAWVK